MDRLVQYIIVRRDLIDVLNWSVGALIAQCCHSTTAINYYYHNDKEVQDYFKDVDNMHKVVLQVNDEESLLKVRTDLELNEIKHKLWIEQPEGIPTCIAIKPYYKNDVHKYVKHLKLFK